MKNTEGFYTIERYEALKDENGEYICGNLISTEEHQNTMQNSFMYLSNVIGAGSAGNSYQTYNTTVDGVYYGSLISWDNYKLGFNMAISTRKYYSPSTNIYNRSYSTSAVKR